MLEMKNVFAGYGKTQVLKNLSLSLEKGELMAVVGPNGCGKARFSKRHLEFAPQREASPLAASPLPCKNVRASRRGSPIFHKRDKCRK